jgi:hypothetical protein
VPVQPDRAAIALWLPGRERSNGHARPRSSPHPPRPAPSIHGRRRTRSASSSARGDRRCGAGRLSPAMTVTAVTAKRRCCGAREAGSARIAIRCDRGKGGSGWVGHAVRVGLPQQPHAVHRDGRDGSSQHDPDYAGERGAEKRGEQENQWADPQGRARGLPVPCSGRLVPVPSLIGAHRPRSSCGFSVDVTFKAWGSSTCEPTPEPVCDVSPSVTRRH